MMTPQEVEARRKEIGLSLKELRTQKGLSWYALAQLTGLNQTVIKSVEEGAAQYTIDTYIKIMDAYENAYKTGGKG